ncbi:type I-D CRISPR-associated protein Cas7/Csc2 [Bacillus aquiflavi]|uniref:Type I-D CRISPR-associated protein Cas7/Csc2 n=1 Tax=Bacillus aquiflavi TaxID=2672567 RepID=A0A6B3VYV3_9BACI|nr:type I-D CRISPR-associated protein Cas7/Csc2 [Bacillus aquiflavi]MBA4537826.1 type I-D CRISPR-associated protein Cas7/Csc2 [Bacillus aquiflavi]NEY82082.1 type I-D CRISPR-associated protein Cas7/Csc2 [Bacillus aquiflavi]
MKINELKFLPKINEYVVSEVPLAPLNRKIGFVVLRELASTAVLTTEGQTLDVEAVRAGKKSSELMSRVVLQKRKQVAPERRTGRAFNRQYGLAEEKCEYMKGMCGKCPDCLLYGFAATSGEGSQRSRILTDSAFSIRNYEQIQRTITLNAIEDTTKGGVSGSAFAEREHVRPQVFFPTIETAVDVTYAELIYILNNILTTTRYGAEANRQGFVHNHLVAIVLSNTEVTSNLSITQSVFDKLVDKYGEDVTELPLERDTLLNLTVQSIKQASEQVFAPVTIIDGEELSEILSELRAFLKDNKGVQEWLKQLKSDHDAYLKRRS